MKNNIFCQSEWAKHSRILRKTQLLSGSVVKNAGTLEGMAEVLAKSIVAAKGRNAMQTTLGDP